MRRLVIVGIIGLALLTGCTAQPTAKPTPQATPSAQTLGPLTPTQYIDVMHKIPGFETTDESLLAQMGPLQCAELKQTENWDAAVTVGIIGSQRTTATGAKALTAAVRAYCPGMIVFVPKN